VLALSSTPTINNVTHVKKYM